ncbi:hypothetical protein ACFE04_000270 [Oxalis oulophora]
MRNTRVMNLVVLVSILMSAITSYAAVTDCNQVVTDIQPCYPYLRDGGTPTGECCNNITYLAYNRDYTREDHQKICSCLKDLLFGSDYFNQEYAENLVTSKCFYGFSYHLSPSTDCSSIS